MRIIKKRERVAPGISTASLPDIIFMLLFFFMVTTSFRTETLKINPELPEVTGAEGKERFTPKLNVYAKAGLSGGTLVQVGKQLIPADSLRHRLQMWRNEASAAPETYSLVLHIDKNLTLSEVRKIRHSLKGDAPVRVFYRTETKKSTL